MQKYCFMQFYLRNFSGDEKNMQVMQVKVHEIYKERAIIAIFTHNEFMKYISRGNLLDVINCTSS